MTRDFDLIRTILSEVQAAPPLSVLMHIEAGGADRATVIEHLELLIEAGLIEGRVRRVAMNDAVYTVTRLKWEGQDFLDAAKDDNIWHQAKTTIIESSKSFTFEMLKSWLRWKASQVLGLPT
jgi:hypothetical protein